MRPPIDWTTEGLPSRDIIDSEVARVIGAEPSEENLEQWSAVHPEADVLAQILDSFAGCAAMPSTLPPVLAQMVERIVVRLNDWREWRVAGHVNLNS